MTARASSGLTLTDEYSRVCERAAFIVKVSNSSFSGRYCMANWNVR